MRFSLQKEWGGNKFSRITQELCSDYLWGKLVDDIACPNYEIIDLNLTTYISDKFWYNRHD